MAKRYSGLLTINVAWVDDPKLAHLQRYPHDGYYDTKISIGGKNVWKGKIGAPRILDHAVDSEIAYTRTAEAAISFASEENDEIGNYAYSDESGYKVKSKFHKNESPFYRP
jgi:hypothetical protein